MSCNNSVTYNQQSNCTDTFNCNSGKCPDFIIKRHDTKPPFKVSVSDCNGPLDLTGLILEASMWSCAKFKANVLSTDTSFALADNIGFEQALVGDIIVTDAVRGPEQMLITGFDEINNLIIVNRGYNGTTVRNYKKGTKLNIFRILNAVAQTELSYEDQIQVDGTVTQNVLVKSELVYDWETNDTCVPGCFNFEFKLLAMQSIAGPPALYPYPSTVPSYTPSQISSGCYMGNNVLWVRRFPTNGSFLIQIADSITSENLF